MKITRRSMLGAAAQAALAQAATEWAVSDPSSGIRLQRYGNPQLPAVALFLPEAKTPSAVIEMPEHAWRRETANPEQAWFYKMYGSDPKVKGQVEWPPPDRALAFTMQTPSGYTLRGKATLQSDGVEIVYEVSQDSVRQLSALEAVTCVKLYRPFTDVFLDRTYTHHPDGLELIASDTPDRAGKNAEEWLPCRYIARVGKNAPSVPYRVEKQDGVTRYFKSRAADVAFLATESIPAGWTAATFANDCDSVFTNPARTCHHADPVARDVSDGRATLRLKVYLVRGTVADAWRKVALAERVA